MAHENVTFEIDNNIRITSFKVGTTSEAVDPSEASQQDVSTTSFSEAPPSSSQGYDGPAVIEVEEIEQNEDHQQEMATKSSAVELKEVSSVNGEKDHAKNGNDLVKTGVMVETANRSLNYESSQVLFYVQIAFFAMCGCLARIGTDKLFGDLAKIEDSEEIVNQSFFSNMVGSFVLGALNGSPMGKTRLAALYKGLTTGFCGSYTTWSKWNQQLSLTLVGNVNRTDAVPAVLSITSWFVGFYSYIGSYCVGTDFGKDIGGRIGKHVSRNGPKHADIIVSFLLIFAAIGFAFGVAFDVTQTGKGIWLAVIFAPFGACLRAWLAQFKVEKYKLPLGTLLANMIGAIVLAAIGVINDWVAVPECIGVAGVCWPTIVTYAIGTGFCACLTTISTFMSEVYKLRPEHPIFAYSYAILTVVICQVLCGIINGVSFSQLKVAQDG
ncbi:uncharacterized protein LOC143470590 isoform X1 [Clavelina lepadiformis]|uniref:uncharacterized protein LOC143470590 isoform X1 n=2 Tax=Clavelina lepadiformis TaxID=159417 RepID=UPI00404393B9